MSILGIFRISSLAGMSAVVAAAAAAPLFGYPQFFPVLAAIAVLILYLHRENIGRLIKGEEPKVGSKKWVHAPNYRKPKRLRGSAC